MSKRKFLNEINMMARRGVYPSLRILLEEESGDDSGSDEGGGDSGSDEGGDFSFGDESEDSSSSDGGDDSSSGDGGGDGGESGDTGGGGGEETDTSVDDAKEAEKFADANRVANLDQNLNIITSYNPDEIHQQVVDQFLSHATTVVSSNEFGDESDSVSESYNLSTFLLLNEDSSDLEKKVQNAVDVIDKRQDDIEKVDGYVKSIELKGKGKKINIDALVHKADKLASRFDQHYCRWSIVAADALKTVIKQSEFGKEKENCEKFLIDFVEELDQRDIPHAISINTAKQSDYNTGQGAMKNS